jgi:hypothetical protein
MSISLLLGLKYAELIWTCSMDMDIRMDMDMDMRHRHECEAGTWTCFVLGHAAWTQTCCKDMEMQHRNGHAA